MKTILFFITLLVLAACSPEKRLSRLIKKNPELVKTDTIYNSVEVINLDTIYIAAHSADTLLPYKVITDTIRYEDERLKVMWLTDTVKQVVQLWATCKADTVFKTDTLTLKVPVQVNSVQANGQVEDKTSFFTIFLIGAISIILFLLGAVWLGYKIYKMFVG